MKAARIFVTSLLAAAFLASLLVSVAPAQSTDDLTLTQAVYYAGTANAGRKPGGSLPPPDNTYYSLLGFELTATAGYHVNVAGAPAGALAEVVEAFETWDAATGSELFVYLGESSARGPALDGQNSVSWTGVVPRDIVAMASIWSAPDSDGDGLDEIVEFDITFNTLHRWAIDPDDEGPVKLKREFDVENVATHEVGHVVGLADVYETQYRQLTMYGYTSKGETGKISLQVGDIAGAQYLYG